MATKLLDAELSPRPVGWNRLVLRMLDSPARWLLGRSLSALRYITQDGRAIALPVQVVDDGDRLLVMVGESEVKRWWRHFRTAAPVQVLRNGRWCAGVGLTTVDTAAAVAYQRRFPSAPVAQDAMFVSITLSATPDPPPLRGSALMWMWFRRVTAAEFAGFAVPACVGAAMADAGPELMIPAVLAAGSVEGLMLGWGQASVLGKAIALDRRRWIAFTAMAAVVAYAIGLAPSTAYAVVQQWPPLVQGAIGLVLGTALLLSIGAAQWLILRRHIERAGRWIATTALAWLVGLAAFMTFTMPLWQPGQSVATTIAIGVAGGAIMAATTSLITGAALRRLLAGTNHRPSPR